MRVLHGGQAVILGLEKLSLDDFPDLKVVGCNCTGTDHLPVEEMERRGIKLISLKGETGFLQTITSTAEHTIFLIGALLRNYKTALNGPYKDRGAYRGHVLRDKTLGIIGFGRVGKQVASIAEGFGVEFLSCDKEVPLDVVSTKFSFLGDLLRLSDIVSIHIPLPGNEGFFTREMFKQMKPASYLINTSRDGVIEKGALLWALENKIIAGAAVDFVDDEELVHYARDHDNLILTNHIGGCTEEDMERTEEFIERKVEEYMENQK